LAVPLVRLQNRADLLPAGWRLGIQFRIQEKDNLK
jgi:hypothetical protein